MVHYQYLHNCLAVVRVRFTEDNYAAREDEGPITACIIRDRPIASAFTVTVNANELSPVDAEGEWGGECLELLQI